MGEGSRREREGGGMGGGRKDGGGGEGGRKNEGWAKGGGWNEGKGVVRWGERGERGREERE